MAKERSGTAAYRTGTPAAGPASGSVEWWYRVGSLAALVSYLSYPGEFSRWNNNWLSDRGDRDLNPHGAVFYRIGCAVNGALMIVMFVTVTPWHIGATRRQRVLVGWAQAFGVSAAIALIMTSVYPLDEFAAHQLWSRVLVSAFAGLLFVSFLGFRLAGKANVPIAVSAVVGYAAAVLWLLFGTAHWIEWILVADVLPLVCMIGMRTTGLCQAALQQLRDRNNRAPLPD